MFVVVYLRRMDLKDCIESMNKTGTVFGIYNSFLQKKLRPTMQRSAKLFCILPLLQLYLPVPMTKLPISARKNEE
jgi:hypothetical protein